MGHPIIELGIAHFAFRPRFEVILNFALDPFDEAVLVSIANRSGAFAWHDHPTVPLILQTDATLFGNWSRRFRNGR